MSPSNSSAKTTTNMDLCHVEVQLTPEADVDFTEAADAVCRGLGMFQVAVEIPSVHKFTGTSSGGNLSQLSTHLLQHLNNELRTQIELVRFTDDTHTLTHTNPHTHFQAHAYQLYSDTALDLHHLTEDDEHEHDNDQLSTEKAASVLDLPSTATDGLWDTLVYDEAIKHNLLQYINTTLRFSAHDIDPRVIAWNRIVLLHGPPGTGKTSLAQALAHKLSIRLNTLYVSGRLVEINAHSLFSKWFSESGKLVHALFEMINRLCDDDAVFVTLLIDEVESLTGARQAAVNGNEPSDAIRVVNALLTQIDKLKQRKNVLIIATSNITAAIDDAFVDRADIQQYIGNPSTKAIEVILGSCLAELFEKNLLIYDNTSLNTIAVLCKKKDVSGRFLRKLPLLAFAHTKTELPTKKLIIDAMKTCIENK
ncbi:hypothetical protein E3P91_00919 [Wallemia ichthyophaga]|nr:hypothetical protein E3P91_00919 [Wallemia ichthyophaga]